MRGRASETRGEPLVRSFERKKLTEGMSRPSWLLSLCVPLCPRGGSTVHLERLGVSARGLEFESAPRKGMYIYPLHLNRGGAARRVLKLLMIAAELECTSLLAPGFQECNTSANCSKDFSRALVTFSARFLARSRAGPK